MTTRTQSPSTEAAIEAAIQILSRSTETSPTSSLVEGFDANAIGVLLDLTEEIARSREETLVLARVPQGWKVVFSPGSPDTDSHFQNRMREAQPHMNILTGLRSAVLEKAGVQSSQTRYNRA